MYEDEEEDFDVVPFEGDEYPEDEQGAEQLRQQRNRRLYVETISGVLNAVTEYARTLEHEKTSRANVERKRKTAITVIRSERRVMIEYLKRRFGERGALYDQYFKLIDTALQVENEEILRIALDSIQNIYQDNPCGGIDEFKQQFDAMSEVIRI
jgi:hypothetical protein